MQTQQERETQNALLRSYGYRWRKVMERWQLFAPDGEMVSVDQALAAIVQKKQQGSLVSSTPEKEAEIGDLATYGRQLTLDVSFAEIEVEEIDGVKVEPTKGISVILTGDNPLGDDDVWMFSRAIFPLPEETLPALVQRVAEGLGIKPDERIWENGD